MEAFARRLNKAFSVTGKPKLIVLEACVLGCFTKEDAGGGAVSVVQQLANLTGVPILSPGGYPSGSLLNDSEQMSETHDGMTRYQWWDYQIQLARSREEEEVAAEGTEAQDRWEKWIVRLEEFKNSGYNSTYAAWFLTLPSGQSTFGDIPLA